MPEIPSKFASSSSVIEFGSQKAAAISTSLRKWPLGTKGADVVGRLRVSSYVRRLPDYGGQVPRSRISEYRASHGAPRRKRGKPASLSRLLAGRPKPCPALKRDCLAFANPSVRCGGRKPNSTRAGTRLRSIRRSKSYGWQARSYAGQVASATRIPYQEFGEKATISGSS